MTGHAAVCHPCIAVVALALQGVVAPAGEGAERVQIGGTVVAKARVVDLVHHGILIRVAEGGGCHILGGKAVGQRQIGGALQPQRLVDLVLDVFVHRAPGDPLHQEAQHLEAQVAVLFLAGGEHQLTVADVIQHLGLVLLDVEEHRLPLRQTGGVGQQLMHGDVFLPVLGKLRNVACYRGIQVDLALAVQLHNGLCRGHDLGAGCHVEHGIHLHGAGIVQPHAHVVEHCVAVCLFIHDLAAA